jgi:hypothetical protein
MAKKLCFACFKNVPVLANKCPYCLSENQGVWGRIIFYLVLIGGVVMLCKHFAGG